MNKNYSAYPSIANTTRTKLGWDISGKTSYRINSEGFRGKDFDNISVIALGCSITLGIGVHEEDSWPCILEKKLNKSVANISKAAAGPDTLFRYASYWIPKLKPRVVVYCEPPPYRFEVLKKDPSDKKGLFAAYRFGPGQLTDQEFAIQLAWMKNELNFELNYSKNMLAIEKLCDNNKCDFYMFKSLEHFDADGELGFDDHHPGPNQQKKFAEFVFNKING